MIFCFVHAKRGGDVMTAKIWLAAATALITGLVGAFRQFDDQKAPSCPD